MRPVVWLTVTLLGILGLLTACAPVAPTPVPTKPAAAPAVTSAPPAATKPAAAATTAPAAATEPAAAATTPAAAAPTAAPVAKIKRGGTLNYATHVEANSMDPVLAHTADSMFELPIFESLLRWDVLDEKAGKLGPAGQLAESWEIVNPTTLVLKLRKGVKYQDGAEFNAQSVKWNIERAKTHPKSTGKGYAEPYASVDIVDPYTVRLNLSAPSALAIPNLTAVTGGSGSSWSYMVSKQSLDKMGEAAFELKPVGTGPMQMVEWKRDDRKTLKRWEGYWRKGADGQPLPYMDGIDARVINDSSVILMEMRAGTVDISASLQPPDFPTVKANPNLTLNIIPWASKFLVTGFNQHKGPFAENKKLRQAAMYAIDRDNLARVIGFEAGQPNNYVVWGKGDPGYDETLPKYGFDLAKAKGLMTEAGYADGLDVLLTAYANPTARRREAEMVQALWREIKLRATLDIGEMVAVRAKKKALDFEVAIWGMTSSLDPGHYSRMLFCDGSANWSTYCNKDVEKCMVEGNQTYDNDKRNEIYKRCQKLIYDDALVGGTYKVLFSVTHRNTVKGVRVQSWAMDLQEVWLDK